MTRLSGAAVLGVFLSWSVALHAQDKDPIKEKLDKAKTVYEAERTKLREGLLMNLQKKEKTAREAGDKKLVDQVVAEQEKFESDGVMPTVIPTTEYQRQVRQSFRTVESAYKQAIKECLVAKKDDAAESLGKELEELEKQALGVSKIWIGPDTGNNKWTLKLEMLATDGTDFTGNFYYLEKDVVRHQAKIKGTIIKGAISFKTDNIVKNGGWQPIVVNGTMAGNRIEGSWATLKGGFKGALILDLQK